MRAETVVFLSVSDLFPTFSFRHSSSDLACARPPNSSGMIATGNHFNSNSLREAPPSGEGIAPAALNSLSGNLHEKRELRYSSRFLRLA